MKDSKKSTGIVHQHQINALSVSLWEFILMFFIYIYIYSTFLFLPFLRTNMNISSILMADPSLQAVYKQTTSS